MRAMRRPSIPLTAATLVALMTAGAAWAQAPSASPTCQRLEAQLTAIDRGNGDPARADRIKRAEDALNRQQNEVDRTRPPQQLRKLRFLLDLQPAAATVRRDQPANRSAALDA